MGDERAIEHGVDRAAQPDQLGAVGQRRRARQRAELQPRAAVVEQDAAVEVAHDHALRQLGHQRRQAVAFLLDAARWPPAPARRCRRAGASRWRASCVDRRRPACRHRRAAALRARARRCAVRRRARACAASASRAGAATQRSRRDAASAPSAIASTSQPSSSRARAARASRPALRALGRRRAWPRRQRRAASADERQHAAGRAAHDARRSTRLSIFMHGAAEQLAHLCGQLPGRERLGHVGIGAERHALGDIGLAALGGEHQDLRAGERLVGAHRLQHLEAGLARHHDVEQHQVGPLAADQAAPAGRRARCSPRWPSRFIRNSSEITMLGSSSAIRTLVGHGLVVRPSSRARAGRSRSRRLAPGALSQPHPAAEVLDDAAADRQAQAGALRPVRGVAALAELLEHQRLLLGRHAGAVVLHLDVRVARVGRAGAPRPGRRPAARTWRRSTAG